MLLECEELLMQGAEARVYTGLLKGKKVIRKHRFKKKYRHPDLDKKLTQRRTQQEVRALNKCKKLGVLAPAVLQTADSDVVMEFVKSPSVREHLQRGDNSGITDEQGDETR